MRLGFHTILVGTTVRVSPADRVEEQQERAFRVYVFDSEYKVDSSGSGQGVRRREKAYKVKTVFITQHAGTGNRRTFPFWGLPSPGCVC